jgi:hypothetical protein
MAACQQTEASGQLHAPVDLLPDRELSVPLNGQVVRSKGSLHVMAKRKDPASVGNGVLHPLTGIQ